MVSLTSFFEHCEMVSSSQLYARLASEIVHLLEYFLYQSVFLIHITVHRELDLN